MPAEKLEIMLKPIGFFDQNPALDVPGLKDPKSTLAFDEAHDSETQGAPGGTGSCCS
jgi:primary-amine oxidase